MERKTTMMMGSTMEQQTSNTMQQGASQQQIHHSRQHESNNAYKSFPRQQLLPFSRDFVRLPSSLLRIRNSTSNEVEWIDIAEMERKVLQHRLDQESTTTTSVVDNNRSLIKDKGGVRSGDDGELFQNMQSQSQPQPDSFFSSSSSVLASECFTRAIERDGTVGLGMSLREYDGCVYVQALLQNDGSRAEDESAYSEVIKQAAMGPAYKSGLLPGDRLLGLNGRPFLNGRMAATSSSSSSSSSSS